MSFASATTLAIATVRASKENTFQQHFLPSGNEGLGITEAPVSVDSLQYETKQEGSSGSKISSDSQPAPEHAPSAASTFRSALIGVLAAVWMQL